MARALFKSWFVDFDPVRAKAALKNRSVQGSDRTAAAGDRTPTASDWTAERARAYLDRLNKQIADLFPDRLVPSELREIPEGWQARKLGDVIEIHDNKRIPLNSRQRANREGPFPYYGAASIMDYVNDFLFDGVHVLTGEDGSVIDAEGHPVIQYVWGQFWVNNHAHVLRGRNGVSHEHLYLLLKRVNVLAFVTGAVQPKLSQRNLRTIPIAYPGRTLCREFSTLLDPLFAKVRNTADDIERLTAQRDALLSKLVSRDVQVEGITK